MLSTIKVDYAHVGPDESLIPVIMIRIAKHSDDVRDKLLRELFEGHQDTLHINYVDEGMRPDGTMRQAIMLSKSISTVEVSPAEPYATDSKGQMVYLYPNGLGYESGVAVEPGTKITLTHNGLLDEEISTVDEADVPDGKPDDTHPVDEAIIIGYDKQGRTIFSRGGKNVYVSGLAVPYSVDIFLTNPLDEIK